VIDYHTTRFEDEQARFDVVFDTVGGETLMRSWSVLKPAGRMVTIASGSEGATDERVKAAFFIVEPSAPQLTDICRLIDAGELRPVLDRVVPFERAAAAFRGEVKRAGRGKLVIAIADPAAPGM
jgi:NADPH:quinone reductase-like Zn-dependent oxidoreductase